MNADDSVLSIPEIRDYHRINAELVQRLDEGQKHVRLVGAERQRLLLAELSGAWTATVEIEGETGPELAAALNAPGLTVVARGPSADGAARGFRAGRLILLGAAGDALGYGMEGGTVLANEGAGHRAGLDQRGGVLLIRGPVGRLAGERQGGGRLFVSSQQIGPHSGHGRRGGTLLRLPHDAEASPDFGIDRENAEILKTLLREAGPWLSNRRAGDARA
jgi:glutamate synthase domain-containing protein 3